MSDDRELTPDQAIAALSRAFMALPVHRTCRRCIKWKRSNRFVGRCYQVGADTSTVVTGEDYSCDHWQQKVVSA